MPCPSSYLLPFDLETLFPAVCGFGSGPRGTVAWDAEKGRPGQWPAGTALNLVQPWPFVE